MDPVTVKAANVILTMLAKLPFLVGFLVAVAAYVRRERQGHFSVFFGMALTHFAMAGLTGDTGV